MDSKTRRQKRLKKRNNPSGDAWLTTTLVSATAKVSGAINFTALRSTYQESHGLAYDDYRIGIEEEIKTDPNSFSLSMLILRKNVLVIHLS
jgi:hypothetical protein